MTRQIEVLAPAGSMESLKAAFLNGADAVYLGGELFGARAYANNFSQEELIQAIEYAHKFHKKIYLTINTLVKESEIKDVVSYLRPYYEAGLDAVLIQDLGVLMVVKEHFPDLELHASTQMTVTTVESAMELKKLGMKRVVPARELSLNEIKKIKDETNLDVECFVHGALCYCYSGQCFMSSMIGGRSGNRGRCAGTCRLPFDIYDGNQRIQNQGQKYLLSQKDLCTIDILPEIIEAGVDSLKIEGRMKNPEYVGEVTRIYRKYTDLYLSQKPYKVDENDRLILLELFNRGGFTRGYYKQHNGKDMMAMHRPNHQGIKIGVIEKLKGGTLSFKLEENLHKGDILEISIHDTECVELTSPLEEKKGNMVTLNGQKLRKLKLGMPIYRTKNQKLRSELEEHLKTKNKEKLKGKVKFLVGTPVTLEIWSTQEDIFVEGAIVDVAQNRPMDEAQIAKQLKKTGETDYVFESLEVEVQGAGFLPVKALKDLRRKAFDALEEATAKKYHREYQDVFQGKDEKSNKEHSAVKISVAIDEMKYFDLAVEKESVSRIYVSFLEFIQRKELWKKLNHVSKEVFLTLPQVTREQTLKLFEENIELMKQDGVRGFLVQSMDQIHWLMRHHIDKHMMFNYNVYNYNQRSVRFYQELLGEQVSFTFPAECNLEEMENLGINNGEIYYYGHFPVMISAQCQKKDMLGCDHKPTVLRLKDRKNQDFYVKNHCKLCYNEILNGVCTWLGNDNQDVMKLNPEYVRLHFTIETVEEINEVIDKTAAIISGQTNHVDMGEYTKGHFKRGIL